MEHKLSILPDQEAENWKHLHRCALPQGDAASFSAERAEGQACGFASCNFKLQETIGLSPSGLSIGKMTRWRIAFPPRGAGVDIQNDDEKLEVQMQSEKKECMVPTSSSSANVLLNIQSAMSGLLPMPSSRAASSTDARRALDSLGAGFEVEDVVDDFEPLLGLCKGAGRGTGACGRGKVKVLSIMFGGLPV